MSKCLKHKLHPRQCSFQKAKLNSVLLESLSIREYILFAVEQACMILLLKKSQD